MTAKRKNQFWTVRNSSGQYIATYRAKSEHEAIDRLIQDQRGQASQFKRMTVPAHSTFTAKVEN